MSKSLKALLIMFGLATVSGCTNFFKPYYLTIDQGNIFKEEQIEQLELGMSRRQVRYIMGTPSLISSFANERWDYVYTLAEKDQLTIEQKLSILFEADRVTAINKK